MKPRRKFEPKMYECGEWIELHGLYRSANIGIVRMIKWRRLKRAK